MKDAHPEEWKIYLKEFSSDKAVEEELRRLVRVLKRINEDIINPKLKINDSKEAILKKEEDKIIDDFWARAYVLAYDQTYKSARRNWSNIDEYSNDSFSAIFSIAYEKGIQEARKRFVDKDENLKYKIVPAIINLTKRRIHDKYKVYKKAPNHDDLETAPELAQPPSIEEVLQNNRFWNTEKFDEIFKEILKKKHWRVFIRWLFLCDPSLDDLAQVFGMKRGSIKTRKSNLKKEVIRLFVKRKISNIEVYATIVLRDITDLESKSTAKEDFRSILKKIFVDFSEKDVFTLVEKKFKEQREKEILLRWTHFIENTNPKDQANAFEFTSMEDFYLYRYDVVKELNETLKK